jgi:serine/threonine protein kinase
MLLALHRKGHEHIINLYATYKFDGKYHLIFPYANANLRVYWNAVGMPHKNRPTFLWFIKQAYGIASAVNVIHNFISDDSGRLGVPRPEDKYGRHGDIKPENILWFRDESGGVLRIADFGLGKFHRAVSRSEVDPATIKGSQTYSPPEVALRQKISRAYDIWTIGCMFLEFTTWLLLGGSAIYEFTTSRKVLAYDGGRDDTFFTVTIEGKSRKAILRPEVETWIKKLGAHEACSPMISDFFNIIRECLKIVPGDRLKAKDLEHRLGAILARARTNRDYLT